MTTKIFIDRSRYETAQRCSRARYLEYHWGGTGIQSSRKPLPLAVGGAVHTGLANLLIAASALWDNRTITYESCALELEDHAVAAALADFAQHKDALDAEIADSAPDATIVLTGDPMLDALLPTASAAREFSRSRVDDYLYAEQSALVEALVRAYARCRLRPLLEQFEVLEVEREGEWQLGDLDRYVNDRGRLDGDEMERWGELWFMSRPDALLRDRESNQLYLLSYKTTGAWDVRKARDAEHDMQGLSEGIEIEQRLAKWWRWIKDHTGIGHNEISNAMHNYLETQDAPPRIFAVRMEYLLKGERWKNKDLSDRFSVEMRMQKTHLIYQYHAVSTPTKGTSSFSIGDVCWSWEYIREDEKDSKLAWQNWKTRPVWDQPGGVHGWIDKLDDAAPLMSGEDTTMGLEPRLLGYKSDAQALGVTHTHPLDEVFVPPMVIYRNDDDLRDLVEQMEAAERRIAEGVAVVDDITDEGALRHALNVHFPMVRRACEYPTTCQFTKLCYGGEDIRRDPLASGKYKARVPNHPQENQNDG